jgi:hypothetical protein
MYTVDIFPRIFESCVMKVTGVVGRKRAECGRRATLDGHKLKRLPAAQKNTMGGEMTSEKAAHALPAGARAVCGCHMSRYYLAGTGVGPSGARPAATADRAAAAAGEAEGGGGGAQR